MRATNNEKRTLAPVTALTNFAASTIRGLSDEDLPWPSVREVIPACKVGLWRPQRADPGHRGGLSESRHTSISCRWAPSPSAPFPMLSCLLRRCGRIQVCQGVPNGFWQQPGAPTYPPHSTSPALKARVTFSCSVSGAGRFGSMSQPDLQGGAGKALVVKASYT